jgi:hypothetical protein
MSNHLASIAHNRPQGAKKPQVRAWAAGDSNPEPMD